VSAEDEHAISYLALPRGVPVFSADGVQVGTVHRALDNVREHIFDGIVFTTEKGRRFVDAPEVATITNRRVTLTIDADEVADLPLESGGQAPSRGWKRFFGR
jgi:hypothetical protein